MPTICLRLHFPSSLCGWATLTASGATHPIGIHSVLKEALQGQQVANTTVTKLGMATGGNLGIFTIMLGQARKVVCSLYLSFPGGNPPSS